MATSGFGKAFREARAAGDKTFEFNGKKYTTELASQSEQPSVGGKVSREYKSRDNRSPMAPTMVQGGKRTSMARKPDDETMAKSGESRRVRNMLDSAAEATGVFKDPDYMAKSAESRGVRNMYERGAEEAAKEGMKKGGAVSASRRADGIAQRGKTRGKVC
jgi:hypothetical protein